MLRRGVFVALGALAARVLAADAPVPVAGRALNVSADVDVDLGIVDVDADVDVGVNEKGVDIYAGLTVGSPLFCKFFAKHCGGGGYPEVSTTTVTIRETAVITETKTETETYTDTVSVPFTETIVNEETHTVSVPFTETVVNENTITQENTVTQEITRTVVEKETLTQEITKTLVDDNTVTRTVVEEETITQEITRTLVEDGETLTRDITLEVTAYVPTTIIETQIIPTSFWVTLTVDRTIISTVLTTEFRTITTTIVSSVPGPTITQPGATITLPPQPTSPPETVTITEVSACPAPTNAPGALVAAFDPKSDLTWGCKPGFICKPAKPQGCNVWADSPADNYVCAPEECVPAPPIVPFKWPENETAYYPPSDTYFNLDPRAFGLSFDIFEPPEVIVTKIHGHKTTITKGNYGSQSSITHYPPASETPYGHDYRPRPRDARPVIRRSLVRRGDGTVYPEVCFDDCDAAYLESQKSGKSDALCRPGSAFLTGVAACQACVALYDKDTPSTGRTYLPEKFAQFIEYCGGSEPEPTTSRGGGTPPESQVESQSVTTRSQGGINTDTSVIPITPTTSPTASPTASPSQEQPTDSPTATPTASSPDGPSSSAGPTDEVSPTPTTTGGGGGGGGGGGATETPSGESTGGSSSGGSSPSGGGSGGGGGGSGGDRTEDADPSLPSPTSTEGPVQAMAASTAPGLLMAILPILAGLFFV